MSTSPAVIPLPMSLGRRIAEARRAAGLDQDELAARWGESRSTISRWERDKGQPRFAHMVDLSRISGWDLSLFASAIELFDGPERGPDLHDSTSRCNVVEVEFGRVEADPHPSLRETA